MTIGIKLEAARLRIGDGALDTAERYLRQVDNPADGRFWMTEGPTVAISVDGSDRVSWRFECGPYTVSPKSAPAAGFAVDRLVAI